MPGQNVHLPRTLDIGATSDAASRPAAALARAIEAQPRWVVWRLALGASLLFWVAIAVGIAALL